MSDICERLRELKRTQVLNHTAAKWIDEAAAEIDRLRFPDPIREEMARALNEIADLAASGDDWGVTILQKATAALSKHRDHGEGGE